MDSRKSKKNKLFKCRWFSISLFIYSPTIATECIYAIHHCRIHIFSLFERNLPKLCSYTHIYIHDNLCIPFYIQHVCMNACLHLCLVVFAVSISVSVWFALMLPPTCLLRYDHKIKYYSNTKQLCWFSFLVAQKCLRQLKQISK